MPILHKFYQTNWNNGFQTHNSILDITPYEPEVMFIGTFNPDTPNANFADFFYGRNFFWTGFKNLFIHNAIAIANRRMPQNGPPPAILNPTLNEIFDLCITLKLSFADLISEVLHHNNPQYHLLPNDNVVFNGNVYNLIQDGQQNNIGGLEQLNNAMQVHWNTNSIIKYLCDRPSITQIYFTRRPTGIWGNEWNRIVNSKCMAGRLLTNIYTPSGRRLRNPVMNNLLHHWVHYVGQRFGRLENNWLQANGVTLANF